MAYTKRYTDGFADTPTETTPIDSTFLNAVEAALLKLLGNDPSGAKTEVPVWDSTTSKFVFQSIKNTQIDASAAIDWTKINSTGVIKDADIAASAAISKSKLALTASIADSDIAASTNLHKLAAVTGTPDGTKFLRDDGSWQKATVTTITGSVNSTGTINGGTGFTVNKTGTGAYTITFTTAFNNPPLVLGAGSGTDRMFSVNTVGTTSFQVLTFQGTTASDTSFYFLARDLV